MEPVLSKTTGVVTRSRSRKSLTSESKEEPQQTADMEEEQIKQDDSDQALSEDVDPCAFDGTELVTGLFFGSEGCAIDHAGRLNRGITHVLAIITAFEQGFEPDPDMVLAGQWQTYERENRPTADLLNILDDCVDFINEAFAERGKICIVSLEGVSRSATICIAYLIKILGMTLRNAHELVASHKPEVSINRGFWRQLVAFEESVRGCVSMGEEELPGAILFEKAELGSIISRFKRPRSLMAPLRSRSFGTPLTTSAPAEFGADFALPNHLPQPSPCPSSSEDEDDSGGSANAMAPAMDEEEQKGADPLSPTSATGISLMSLGSPNPAHKRKAFDWRAAGSTMSAAVPAVAKPTQIASLSEDTWAPRNKSPRVGADAWATGI